MASKGDESTTPKEVSKEVEVDITTPATESHHASSDILQAISSMKANLDQTNQILATLMAERKRPPTWLPDGDHPSFKRSMTEHDLESVASKNATSGAAQTANFPAAQTANFTAAQTANFHSAQTETTFESTETSIDPMQRSSEEDVLSLYGGKEFDDHQGSDLEEEVDNDSLLNGLNELLLPSEDQGPPISDQLAKIVNAKFATEFDLQKRKTILEKYKVPKICESLLVPKVNPEIWAKLPTQSKRGDIRMSSLQDSIARVTGSISSTIDDLLKAREKKSQIDFKAIIAQLLDCTVLLGHVNQEMSFKRRDSLRPHLSNDFKQACSRNLKPSKMLFGDDLPKTIEALKATNKVVNNIAYNSNGARQGQRFPAQSGYANSASYKAYNPSRGGYSNRAKSFLGAKGRMSSYPPRQAYTPRPQQQHQQQKKFTKP